MEKISHLQLLVLKFWSWFSSCSRWVHKNRVYLLSPCLSPPQLVGLCANKAVWCERSWDCHGIQAPHKLWVCSCTMDPARLSPCLWQVTCRQDFTGLQIPGNYLHTGNFWERVGQDAWEGSSHRQLKAKYCWVWDWAKLWQRQGGLWAWTCFPAPFVIFSFHPSPSKPPCYKLNFKTAQETDLLFPSTEGISVMLDKHFSHSFC